MTKRRSSTKDRSRTTRRTKKEAWSTTPPATAPLCGNESITAVYTDDPTGVTGCAECLELVVEDLQDHNDYLGRCLHCRQEITAQGGVQWSRVIRRPCPHCGAKGW